jgi:hypothetical protein
LLFMVFQMRILPGVGWIEVHFLGFLVLDFFLSVLVFPRTVECCSIHYRGRVCGRS